MGISPSCKIGLTLGGLVTLASLEISSPLTSHMPWMSTEQVGDGTYKSRGSAWAEWYWAHLTQPEMEALRLMIPGASAVIFISTPVNIYRAYTDFNCVAIWPEDEKRSIFKLRFEKLVLA